MALQADELLIPLTGGSQTPRKQPRRRANGLDGKMWTRYSISIWSDIRRTAEETALRHPAMFPVVLAERLIQVFTNASQETVLDPFVGVGTTALAAKNLGKHGIGIELSSEFAEIARHRCDGGSLFDLQSSDRGTARIYTANALRLGEFVEDHSVDLVITSPPYWNVLEAKRTADQKANRTYGADTEDFGKIADYGEFLRALQQVFRLVSSSMCDGAYCCVVLMDIRKKDRFYPFHSDVAAFMQEIGFTYDDLIIWDRRHEYNNMRPLGYPAVFRINKAHEYILILRKPIAASRGSNTS